MFLLLLPLATAWDVTGSTWPAEAFPIPYEVASDLGEDVDDTEALLAVQLAFETWAAVECAGVSFTYVGRADDATWGVNDGRNVVFLYESGWPSEPALVSAPSLLSDGSTYVDVDIALNGQDWAWSTTDADGRTVMDVQSSVTHEVGHLLGLWHSTVSGATLNPAMDGNPDARSLEEDDVDGVCSLYDLVRGDGVLGDSCVESTDCVAGYFCLADGAEQYCSRSCDDASPCDEGYECLEVGDGTQVCAVALEEQGCGCHTGGPAGGAAGLLVAAAALWGRRRGRV